MTPSHTPRDASGAFFHLKHEWDGAAVLPDTIVTAVAAIKGREPTALPVLAHQVDTDALDALFEESREEGSSTDFLQLSYADCGIIIHRNGHVVIQPSTQ
jgi:hypothetical protein